MAESRTLSKACFMFFAFLTVFNVAAESNFKTVSLWNSVSEKLDKSSAKIINSDIENFNEPVTLFRSVRPLRIQQRFADKKTNITTKITDINDTHHQLMVNWVGVGSNVIICLAKSPRTKIPSSLYISYDYGDSFDNKTEFFALDDSKSTYASLDKFYGHPTYINHIVFADVINGVIFTTKDSGKTFSRVKLAFNPSDISFQEDEPLTFLAHDKTKASRELWLTKDFGQSWTLIQESVKTFFWSGSSSTTSEVSPVPNIIPMKGYPYQNESSLELFVERLEPSKKSTVLSTLVGGSNGNKVWMTEVHDFKLIGDFMFVIKSISKDNLDLYVSYRRGPFVKAVFPSELNRLDYHILDTSEGQIFVAVSHTETLSNLYTSQSMDEKNIFFTLSLERILCFFPNSTWKNSWLTDVTEESFADFHKVKGLRGIYIASQVQQTANSSSIGPEHLLTLITFDRGGEWRPLTPPPLDDDGLPIKCNVNDGCSLHLSQKFNQLYPTTRSVPILTSKSAPGIIMATGTIGKSLKGHPKVFLSRDGGLSWRQILKDYYFFNFGDHGGILVAVKFYKSNGKTRELLYSTDEGERFLSHEFHTEDLKVFGLMTEPGENTTVFTMFGSASDHHRWLIIKVDLRNAFSYDCTPDDYKFWSPSSKSGPKMPCILGKKEVFERRIAHSNCYNGRNYNRPVKMEICECDIEDFECDFGFERSLSLRHCVRNKTLDHDPYEIPKSCRPGGFYNRTKGYKKIPGDACIGGNEKMYLPDMLPCPMKEKKEFLLVAQRDKISRIDLKDSTVEVLPILQTNLKNVITIEFDMKNNCVYWADITLDIIGRQCLSNGSSAPEILVTRNSSSIEGMALDWVSNNLYFVDGMKAEIEVIRTDINNQGRMRKTILTKKDLKKPRGITVHPMAGYLFWTDWAVEQPSVSRANLNGSDIRRLFTKPVVEWPNGITIDYISERIYWVDAKLDNIASADLDGKRFERVIVGDDRVSHPFAVAVFKDFVYWDDWKQSGIFVADKDHGVGIQPILQNIFAPMDLKVFAHSFQEGTNPCGNATIHKCSHLCFGGPGGTYSCECPQDKLLIDGECKCPGRKPPDENGACPSVDHTCASDYFMCANKLCIPRSWRCDNDDDCSDGSDEINCTMTTCASNMFACPTGQCIPMAWKCDFDEDCNDGADEKNCVYGSCKSDDFRCKNGRCIHMRYKCDSENDCKDNSDEEDCPVRANVTCKPDEFKCGTACIPNSWKCDGDKDCSDGEDEVDCQANGCESWQFQCANKKCIFETWVCDGENDCEDTSDERDCKETKGNSTNKPPLPPDSCNEWSFKCKNERCIPLWWKCDNVDDCKDMSDEIGCETNETMRSTFPPTPHHNTTLTCELHQFRCYSGECIQDSWVCDGMNDCDLGEDELHCQEENKCEVHQFLCRTDGACIMLKQVCDGKVDCPDGSDEHFCEREKHLPTPASPSCQPGFFPCDGTRCIPLAFVCDQHQVCYDGTDESNCDKVKRVYQVLEMGVDQKSINSSSFLLYWWISLPQNTKFQFMPSIAEGVEDTLKDWVNTTWVEDSEYRFVGLKPYTTYTMAVYVKLMNETEAFPPATFVVSTTLPGVPTPPRNVSVVQKSFMSAEVSWLRPETPNGPITSYVVGMTPPVPAVLKSVPGFSTKLVIKYEFAPNQEYTFWVTAENDGLESNVSNYAALKLDSLAFIEPVEGLAVANKRGNRVQLSWNPVPNVDGYHIQPVIPFNMSYPRLAAVKTGSNTTVFTFENLAPNVSYAFEVSAFRKNFVGPTSSIQSRTPGVTLPRIAGLTGRVVEGDGTTVHLSWKTPEYPFKVDWVYGVYHAVKMSDIFNGTPIKVTNLSATVSNLAACESYLFNVGLVGPLGVGPLAPPLALTTLFNKNASPKRLSVKPDLADENAMVVQWESSCKTMAEAIGYEVIVTEINLNKSSSVTLLPTMNSKLEHTFKTHYGGRYSISVSTTSPKAIPSPPIYYDAPEIFPPHQIQVLPTSNGSITVIWRENELPKAVQQSSYKYVVFVSEGSTLNLSSAVHFDVDSTMFTYNDAKEDGIYSFAVQLLTKDGYSSRISEIISVKTPQGSAENQMFFMSNLVSTTVPIVLPLLTLAAVLAFLVYRHRKLKRSTSNYANSHYDTRSGSTTFGGPDVLEDDDSPNIRGFSDDEPLVLA